MGATENILMAATLAVAAGAILAMLADTMMPEAFHLGGNIVAYNPANGTPLWHSHIGQVTNAPETYMLDGRQYILIATGDTLYAFNLY